MTTLSKEEYLKRYLDPVKSGDYKKRKKKNKEKAKAVRGMKIFDDDIGWSKITPQEEDDLPEELLMKEEKPSVEEIDERTDAEKALDLYRKGDKWKMVDAKTADSSRTAGRHDSDSDMDVPRPSRHDSTDESADDRSYRKKNVKHDSDSDLDVNRRRPGRHDSSSDSTGGRRHDTSKRDARRSHNSERTTYVDSSRSRNSKKSARRRSYDSDGDSKPLKSKHSTRHSKRRQESDSDLEVPRPRASGDNRKELTKQRLDSDSDLDLPRPDSSYGAKKQSSGAVGGLTSRQELKRELREKKKLESNMDHLAKESQAAATIFREKGGKKRDLEKEKIQKQAQDAEKKKKSDKYNQWGKGLTQTEMKDYALEDLIHEASKPLARYADDADLDALQRSKMRDGDPMAEYLARKRTKEAGNAPRMPKYNGPAPAPNRYGIQPGYRWDGVDRSNGFEKKYFHSKSERGALDQEAYKWSVEDM